MRRIALLLGLVLVPGLGLSGIGTAAGEEPQPQAIHPPMPGPEMPVPPGITPMEPPTALAPVGPQLPVPLAPPITSGFEAIPDNNLAIPPDTHGAVGPTKIMTILNTQYLVQLRDGTPVGAPQSLNSFWSGLRTAGAFDPRVKFDPDPTYGGRWIWVSVQGAKTYDSGTLVAVSPGVEPVRGFGVLVDADSNVSPAPIFWADYPTVGFNKNWVVVQVNIFDYNPPNPANFQRSLIYVFDKARLYNGTTGPCVPAPTATGCTLIDATGLGFTQVPAATYDFTLEEMYLLNTWSWTVGVLRLFRLDGPIGDETLTALGFPAAPPWSHSAPGGVDFAPQSQAGDGCYDELGPPPGPLCPDCKIQTNDSRVQNLVFRNGTLWTAHTVFYPAGGSPNRSSIQWWQIAPDASVVQRGLIDDSLSQERFYAFPSIAVNRHSDVLLGYSSFHATEYAAARYSFRYGTDPLDTLQPEEVLKDGEDCYFKDLGSGRNRWGDYSHTVVDPTDDTKLWTVQEYAATSDTANPVAEVQDKWSTWWGMMDPTRTITIADASGPEGDVPTTPLTFTLTLSEPSAVPVTVDWSTQDGTATLADNDYVQVVNQPLTFAPGTTTQTLTVDIVGDGTWEADETFFVDLFNPDGAVIADNQAVGVILNDDPQISISDVQEIEGSTGLPDTTNFIFTVSLSNPSPTLVTVDWTTVDNPPNTVAGPIGTGDFTGASAPPAPPLSFAPGVVKQDIVVTVHGDLIPESDEVFYVDLTGASKGSRLKFRGVGTIIDDDAVDPAPVGLTIVADSTGSGAADGRTRVQWMNPADADGYIVRWNYEANCPAPTNATGGSDGVTDVTAPIAAGSTTTETYTGLNLAELHCYTVWLKYNPGPTYSPGVSRDARPYDSVGTRVKWKLFSGMSLLAQPTVGWDAVAATGNDGFMQSMTRGPAGGTWPLAWRPRDLQAISQQRNPIVPLAGGKRMFIATQDGRVHAVDTADGALIWSTQLPEGDARGVPAGIFTAFGGAYDYILVGTSSGSGDRLYALNPLTGAVIDAFPQLTSDGFTGMGAVNGMPTIDYANKRVYFASWKGSAGGTVWCLKLGPSSDALSLDWQFNGPNDVNGSVVLHNGRVFVGDAVDTVWAIPASGPPAYAPLSLGDGEPKGFLFPDRRGNELYVATNNNVWAITDTGSALNTTKWAAPAPVVNPSVVLHHPGTDDIYVGVEDDGFGSAAVVKINASTGAIVSSVALENTPMAIGPPSLDLGPPGMLHMGSVAGILYAVELGF